MKILLTFLFLFWQTQNITLIKEVPGGILMEIVATPTLDNDTGSYVGSVAVTFSDATAGATIHTCTTVGSDCTPASDTTNPVTVTVTDTHVCATASKVGWITSLPKCMTATITEATAPEYASIECTNSTGSTSMTCELNSVPAGAFIIIDITSDAAHPVSSLTDSAGSTVEIQDGGSHLPMTWNVGTWVTRVYYVVNASSGTHTITAQFSSGTPAAILGAHVYTGVASSSPIDVWTSDVHDTANLSGTYTSPSITTTQTNELIWAWFGESDGRLLTVGSSYTLRSTAYQGMVSEDKASTTTGSYDASMGNYNGSRGASVIVAVKH